VPGPANPTQWDNGYFDLLFGYEWELVDTPAGAKVWHAVDVKDEDLAPDAEDASIRVPTMMTTADIALREDPEYKKISKHFMKIQKNLQMPLLRPGLNYYIEIWVQKLGIWVLKFHKKKEFGWILCH
jgi:catalase (peroxidase I)